MMMEGTAPLSAGNRFDDRKSGKRQFCVGCLAICLVFAGLVVASIFLYDNVLEKKFDVFTQNDNETIEFPPLDEAAPLPDVKDLIEFVIYEESLNHLNVGVKPTAKDDEIEKLNLYLSRKRFLGSSMFNIAYLNREAPESGEVIAVYNYNEFSGTDNLTILQKEPGLRFPHKD